MTILAYADVDSGAVKKTGFEAVAYAAAMGGEVIALVPQSAGNAGETGKYGAKSALQADLSEAGPETVAALIAAAVEKTGADLVVLPKSLLLDLAAPMAAVKIGAALGTNALNVASADGNTVTFRKGLFSGKAFGDTVLSAAKKVLTITKGAVVLNASGADISPESFDFSAPEERVKVTETVKAEGDILLPDADIVVSAGRGLKGPENWGMIEDLAKTLGAATACSKPVSDMDWRPHHEHVGQTGIKVNPTLYIAVGISGAIQHLAGVNQSKVIVVINKDAEAPFFKSADFGIVGDAFDVVPKLHEAIKAVL